jgi:hypothetical protein
MSKADWKDLKGGTHSFDTMSHGYLSNIHYYMTYIIPSSFGGVAHNKVLNALKLRFDGELLPYAPKLPEEFEVLNKMGAFRISPTDGMDIVIDDKVIGNVSTQTYHLMII